jgi:hypothetical protein
MFYWDALERIVVTFVQGFGIALVAIVEATDQGYNFDTLFSAATLKAAAFGAFLSLVKSLVANKLPGTAKSSASLLPKHLDPPQESGNTDAKTIAIVALVVALITLGLILLR